MYLLNKSEKFKLKSCPWTIDLLTKFEGSLSYFYPLYIYISFFFSMKEMVKIIWVNVIYFRDTVFRFKSLDTKTLIVCVFSLFEVFWPSIQQSYLEFSGKRSPK